MGFSVKLVWWPFLFALFNLPLPVDGNGTFHSFFFLGIFLPCAYLSPGAGSAPGIALPLCSLLWVLVSSSVACPWVLPRQGKGQGPAPSSSRRGEGRLWGCYFHSQMTGQRLGGNPWAVKPGAGGRLKVFGPILYCVSTGWVSKAGLHKPTCESPFPTQWSSNVPASDGAPFREWLHTV